MVKWWLVYLGGLLNEFILHWLEWLSYEWRQYGLLTGQQNIGILAIEVQFG